MATLRPYEDRPELSLSFVIHTDPRGGCFGAWRLASVARVIATLRATDEGRTAFELLSRERAPVSVIQMEKPIVGFLWFSLAPTEPWGSDFIFLPFGAAASWSMVKCLRVSPPR